MQITQLTPRREVIFMLTQFRGEINPDRVGKPVARNTFWKWCDACSLEPFKSHFTNSEIAILKKLVLWYENGGKKAEFEQLLIQELKNAQ